MESVFFFQAEDGIRDRNVTGVQTCALPIYTLAVSSAPWGSASILLISYGYIKMLGEIGRASCRERVDMKGGVVCARKEKQEDGQQITTQPASISCRKFSYAGLGSHITILV